MWKAFSRRETDLPDKYRYDLPEKVRKRILHTLDQAVGGAGHRISFTQVVDEVRSKLLRQYGGLKSRPVSGMSVRSNPAIEHFLCCGDEMALDFIEFCFQVQPYPLREKGVEAVNGILQEEHIGYELTPFREVETDEIAHIYGTPTGGKVIRFEFPRFIRIDGQFVHQAIVRPCLDALTNPLLKTAEDEMLKAHGEYSRGHFADAITSCGSAFESVLKTVCDRHGWPFDRDKDTCSKLVGICKEEGLFPPFYAPIFEATGTIRNKLGDAHGRGPTPLYSVTKEHADHMIQVTSAHITLIVKLANL